MNEDTSTIDQLNKQIHAEWVAFKTTNEQLHTALRTPSANPEYVSMLAVKAHRHYSEMERLKVLRRSH